MRRRLLLLLLAALSLSIAQRASAVEMYMIPKFESAKHFTFTAGQWAEDARFVPFYSGNQLDSLHLDALVGGNYYPYQRMHSYYAQGVLMRQESYTFDGAAWSTLTIDSFVYTGSQMNQQFWFKYQNGSLVSETRFSHEYNTTGQRTRRLEEALFPAPLRNDDDWHYTYDDKGRMTVVFDNDWDGSQWVNKARESWSYNDNGELTEILIQRYTNGQWVNAEKITLTGTPATGGVGKLEVSSLMPFDTVTGAAQTRTVTLSNTGTADVTLPHFSLKYGTDFTLADTANHVIAPGQAVVLSITFTPRAAGQVVDTLFVENSDGSVLGLPLVGIARELESVTPSRTPSLVLWPNPSTSMLRCFNLNPGSIISVLDLCGKTVMSRASNDSEVALDVSKTASGTYIVRVVTNGEAATRNIVILH